jgi:hypothetical protein
MSDSLSNSATLSPPQWALRENLGAEVGLASSVGHAARLATVVNWNRIEPRPRADDLTRPLRAEIRDPAWMLARQWQFGEFGGEDAGVPVQAKLAVQSRPLSAMALGKARIPYDPQTPVEHAVERQTVEPDLMMGLHIGRRWLRQLEAALGPDSFVVSSFRAQYALARSEPSRGVLDALQIKAYPEEAILRSVVGQSGIDGGAVLADIRRALAVVRSPSEEFVGRGVAIPSEQIATVDEAASALKSWFEGLFGAPANDQNTWAPSHLAYGFSLLAPRAADQETELRAEGFPGGRVDWYSFDAQASPAAGAAAPAPVTEVRSFIPSRVSFRGAPNVRWWEFEDRAVGFGLTTASKTDLAKVLLGEFGLIFSNDWFIVPYRAQVGAIHEARAIIVTDNFGFNTLVEPTARRHGEQGFAGNWSLWTTTARDADQQVEPGLFLAPALDETLESKPLDEVLFLRDEMANLVWGVESVIPDPLGGGRDARLAGKALASVITQQAGPVVEDKAALAGHEEVLVRYRLMGSVPENWIPFVAVKVGDEQTAHLLLQGAMPRLPALQPDRENDQPVLQNNVVLPRGTILARDPQDNPNLIHEEEILRDGIIARRTFRHTRWLDGRTFTWSALRKQNGRGQGASGLAFDQILPISPSPAR